MAASAGLEPATLSLTGSCSAIGAKKPCGRQGWTRTSVFLRHGVTAHCNRRYATCRYVVGEERFELSAFLAQTGCSAQTELHPDNWWTWWELNPRSPACKAGAFPLSYKPITGAPYRTRTCTVRTLITSSLPGLEYWSILEQ